MDSLSDSLSAMNDQMTLGPSFWRHSKTKKKISIQLGGIDRENNK